MAKGLGKGLSALITDKAPEQEQDEQATKEHEVRGTLPVSSIVPGQFQPRTVFAEDELNELAESIRQNGIVQPILVRPILDDSGGSTTYEIVAGERRWRAAKIIGLDTIPAIIKPMDDKKALEIALVENIQRRNLNLLEEAEGYLRLMNDFEYTQEGLADALGKSRSQITNTVRLLNLPESVKEMLQSDKISAGHARAMLSAEDPARVAEIVVKRDLNVRQTEKLVKKLAKEPLTERKRSLRDPEVLRLEKELSRKLGLNLNVQNKGRSGKIIIKYENLQELDTILRRLDPRETVA